MKILLRNTVGGLGGLTFLLPVVASLKAQGHTVEIDDPRYGWLAQSLSTVAPRGAQASHYDRVIEPDMTKPNTARQQCGVDVSAPPVKLTLPNTPAKSDTLVLVPFGQWGAWPPKHWQTLITALVGPGKKFAGVLTVTDHRAVAMYRHSLGSFGTVSLDERLETLAPKLAACRAWVACEGGIGHLCGALGVPGVMLRRKNFLPQWAPQQPWTTSIEADGDTYQSVTVDQVISTLNSKIP